MDTDVLLQQLQMVDYVLKANAGDLSHEESLVQPKADGNCLNYVLGHMVAIRCHFLRGFGASAPWTSEEGAVYDRNAPPLTDPAKARPLSEIWAALEQTTQGMTEVISKFTPAQLAQKAPFSPVDNPDETVGSLASAFVFHDAYHAGQTGLLRRVVGRAPARL